MSTSESPKQVEQRAWRSTLDDGIYDMLFGMILLTLAWASALQAAGINGLYGFLPVLVLPLIFWLGKHFITNPRLGMVKFGPKRKTRRLLFLVICAAFIFMSLPLLLAMSPGEFGGLSERVGFPITLGLVAAPVVATAAYALDCPRMFIYAALLFAAIPHAGFLYVYIGRPLNSLISFGVPGIIILGYGIMLLVQFVKKYPLPSSEVRNASQQ